MDMCHELFSVCAFLSYIKMGIKCFPLSQDESIPIQGNVRCHCDKCHEKLIILGAAKA